MPTRRLVLMADLGLLLAVLWVGCSPPALTSVGATKAAPAARAQPTELTIQQDGYRVELLDETGDSEHAGELRAWLARAIHAVSEATGGVQPPLRVVARAGSGGARTFGRLVTLELPDGPRPANADREWVLHHELIHASFPSMPEDDAWLDEGLATHLEPLLRVRAGQLPPNEMWQALAADLPQGAPRAGEGGLTGTQVWHRLYWQGAVFWLNAELVIDRRTHGRRSLHDALCSFARADGDAKDWSTERAFAIMDQALGEPILLDLYRSASAEGLNVQPAQLLADLGVVATPTGISFVADAPSADLRQRMTTVSSRPCVRVHDPAKSEDHDRPGVGVRAGHTDS